jgi:Ca2+-binding RTX toxin-like protein
MPTLNVSGSTDYTAAPFRAQVIGQSIDAITFTSGGSAFARFDTSEFGGANIADTVLITGNAQQNSIYVIGSAGMTSFSAAGWTFANWSSNDGIYFEDVAGDQTWTGSSKADTFYGPAGNDTYVGGDGNDTYYVDSDMDLVIETNADVAAGGYDTIILSALHYTVPYNVERLIMTGAAAGGAGNDGDNTIDARTTKAGVIISVAGGNDLVYGSAFNDTIYGGNGNDTLIGGAGADNFAGSDGDDTYYVDDAADYVDESPGIVGGYDVVIASADFSLQFLPNIEQLVLQGAATHGAGNDRANYLFGGNSGLSLTLDGRQGDDVLFSSLAGGNVLLGGAGNDTLLIYGGNNYANGGNGNDVYFSYSASDVISEQAGSGYFQGDGIDTVYANWNFTMGLGIEQLVLFGTASTGVGSADNNIIYGNGTAGAVTLFGMDGADVLFGGAGNDYLDGGADNDMFFGLGGQNTLVGGAGNDVFYVESAGNTVTELAGGGFDTLYSNVAGVTALAANVEQLILYGAATGGTGTSGNDCIYANSAAGAVTLDGGAGNDYLLGSAMNDVLIGGVGADQIDLQTGGNDFVRYAASGNMGSDIIYGFDAVAKGGGQDLIDISGHSYSAASIGGAITLTSVGAGASTLVTFTAGNLAGTTITLAGVALATMDSTDFLF